MKLISANVVIISTFAFLSLSKQPTFSTTLISPSDSKINYYGRVDFSTPTAPQYGWSGVIIEAIFTGSTIGMKVQHSNAYYDIEIDGKQDTIVNTKTEGEYIFNTNLTESTHTVRIKLRSEDHYTIGTFQGLVLADGQQLSEPPSKPLRKIEFIGDSFTAGYGIESPGRQCTQTELKEYTNVFKTFTTHVTDAFHAQNIVLGWSGAGMVRNYGEGEKRSDKPFPYYYDFLFGAGNDQKWDFSQWIPDLVVICLGTNDYSTTPVPDDSMYIGDYHKFINRILENYTSDVPVLCVSTGNAAFEKNVKTVVEEQKSIHNHTKVYFAPYPPNLSVEACDWHPSIEDNIKVGKALIDTIVKQVGWDTTSSAVGLPLTSARSHFRSGIFQIDQSNGLITINTAAKTPEKIRFFALDGKEILQKYTDENGMCIVQKSLFCEESFVLGNKQLGWKRCISIR